MKYYSTNEISKKWNITSHRIAILAREGRIDGSLLIGNRWMIPENAIKPLDSRFKNNKDECFRFPLLINSNLSLSNEEELLKEAEIEFNACRFKESKKMFVSLSKSNDVYIRITSFIHLCLISVVYGEYEEYIEYQHSFNLLLSSDLKYRNEILLMKYIFDIIMGTPKELFKNFYIDTDYNYHSSALDILTSLSIFTIVNGDVSSVSKLRLDPFEALCQKLEDDGKYYEAQLLHLQLTYSYHMKADKQRSVYHMRKMIDIAKEHNLIYLVSVNVTYLPEIFNSVKDEYPSVLIKKIIHYSEIGHKGYVSLINKLDKQTFYSSLTSKEYKYVYLATQGYTNKKIANAMNTTEFYVSKRLGEIYRKLGVKSKYELVDLFTNNN